LFNNHKLQIFSIFQTRRKLISCNRSTKSPGEVQQILVETCVVQLDTLKNFLLRLRLFNEDLSFELLMLVCYFLTGSIEIWRSKFLEKLLSNSFKKVQWRFSTKLVKSVTVSLCDFLFHFYRSFNGAQERLALSFKELYLPQQNLFLVFILLLELFSAAIYFPRSVSRSIKAEKIFINI
jgi:hypothetical protein